MKKIRLKTIELGTKEVPTMYHLKTVLGGHAFIGPGIGCGSPCMNTDSCPHPECQICLATGDPSNPGVCGPL